MSDYNGGFDGNEESKGTNHGGSSPYDAFEDRDTHTKHNSRGLDHERPRTKERDRERERDRDRRHRDYKDRGVREERGREKVDDYDRHRTRDSDRHRDYDRHKDRRHKHRSRSRSRDRSRNRSRSRSPSRSKSKRASGFDMAPPSTAMLSGGTVPGNVWPHVPLLYFGVKIVEFMFNGGPMHQLLDLVSFKQQPSAILVDLRIFLQHLQ